MSSMRPIRCLATALLVASLAVVGCSRSQPNEAPVPADQPTAATTAPKTPASDDPTDSPTVVLADGRHPVVIKTIDPSRRTVTFDLVQLYWGEEGTTEAAKDHQQSPPDDGFYIRNVNPKLRTLPVRAEAAITVNTLAHEPGSAYQNVSVSLAELVTLMRAADDGPPLFYLTVHHDQVVKMTEQYLP
jgi:hypothetical protein